MYSDSGHSDLMEKLNQATKQLGKQLVSKLEPIGDREDHPHIEDLYSDPLNAGKFYLLTDGSLSYQQNSKTGFYYDNGDLVGFEQQYSKQAAILSTEFYAQLCPYSYQDLMDLVSMDAEVSQLWTQFLICQNALLGTLTALCGDENNPKSLGFQHFKSGEVIIREGDPANEVYSIVEGHADVFVNKVKVGEVLEEEIFGDMALFTKTPRTATVIATRSCMVLVVPQDQFMTLIKNHPKICMNLIEHMARKIVSLNDQVLGNNDDADTATG